MSGFALRVVTNLRTVPYLSDPPVTRHRLRDDEKATICGIRYCGPQEGPRGWKDEPLDGKDCRLCLLGDAPPRPLVERCADACRCARPDGRRWALVVPGDPRRAWPHFYSRDEARAALRAKRPARVVRVRQPTASLRRGRVLSASGPR